MERIQVIVAFGDISGYLLWSKRAFSSPEIRRPFLVDFFQEIEKFSIRHEGFHIKYLGDGFMILQELPAEGHRCHTVHSFLGKVRDLTRNVGRLIKACPYPKPSGFRTRVVSSYVDKIMVTDPHDRERKIPEYTGPSIDLADRLLEASPDLNFICHESVVEILGEKKGDFKFKRIDNVVERPKGVDIVDLEALWMVRP